MYGIVSEETGRHRKGYHGTVFQVKTGGDSSSWNEYRDKEGKTMSAYNYLEQVVYRKEQRNVQYTGEGIKVNK